MSLRRDKMTTHDNWFIQKISETMDSSNVRSSTDRSRVLTIHWSVLYIAGHEKRWIRHKTWRYTIPRSRMDTFSPSVIIGSGGLRRGRRFFRWFAAYYLFETKRIAVYSWRAARGRAGVFRTPLGVFVRFACTRGHRASNVRVSDIGREVR